MALKNHDIAEIFNMTIDVIAEQRGQQTKTARCEYKKKEPTE